MESRNLRGPGGVFVSAGRLRLAGICAFVAAVASGAPALADEVVTHWAMPPIAIPEADRPVAPNVFGTVALPVRARQTGTRWTKLMRASLDQPVLNQLAAQAQGQSHAQQAAFVQAAVDHALRFSASSQDCSDDGYWAAASETLIRGVGDCFDVAIAKMEALRSLGFADKDLYLTTGYFQSHSEPGRRRGTAALLVRTEEGFLLLPDGSDLVIEASHESEGFGDFQPYITYGYGMSWVHGRVVRTAAADIGGGLTSASR